MPVTLEIRGVNELVRKLGQIEANRILRDPMQRAVLRIQRDMADYPPQRPGSSYRRTGTLGRKWTTSVNTNFGGLEGRVGNNVQYAPQVQSQRYQADIHRGRWQTDEDVLDRNLRGIIRDFEQAVREAIT